jgi:phospholipase C
MENRSFDHYFGSLSLLEGRKDVNGLIAGMSNLDVDGSAVPISHLAHAWAVQPDPGHGHQASLTQWNQGKNDGFVAQWQSLLPAKDRAAKTPWIMGYHTRQDLPVSYALADGFALCDRWHCALLGPTWPNRYHSHAATSAGMWANGDPFDGPTPYQALLDTGRSLRCYHAGDLWFPLLLSGIEFAAWQDTYLDGFFEDAQRGTLPNVAIVEPDFGFNDDHPPRDPRQGQLFLASVYEALRKSPQWNRSLMLVLYDEHGGFFDHVPPPEAKGETRGAEGFARLGFRIPGLVIGPLARRGETVHTLIEHSSVPGLYARLFGIPFINPRAELAGDLSEALSLDLVIDANRPEAAGVPVTEVPLDEAERRVRTPGGHGQPELERFFFEQGRLPRDRERAHRRRIDRYWAWCQALGTARFR